MTDSPTLNAGLARRLAEAADGLRDDKYYFFVSREYYPFDLRITHGYGNPGEANDEAEKIVKELSSEKYKKYGPYNTAADGSPSIEWDEIELRFIKKGCDDYIQKLEKDVDAVILSLSAYEKFFEPYYTRLYGVSVAADLKKHVTDSLTASAYVPVRHSRGTIVRGKSNDDIVLIMEIKY